MTETISSWDIPTVPYIEEKNEKWSFSPKPLENESFLSWFTRLAKENCSDVIALYYQLINASGKKNIRLESVEKDLAKIQTNKSKMQGLLEILLPFLNLDGNIQTLFYPLKKYKKYKNFLLDPLITPRFCPHCLKEDELPYIRLNWFLKPFVICPKHKILLSETCPHCNSPIKFWKSRWNGNITTCYNCYKEIHKNGYGMLFLENDSISKIILDVFTNKSRYEKEIFFRKLWNRINPHLSHINGKIPIEYLYRLLSYGIKNLQYCKEISETIIPEKQGIFYSLDSIKKNRQYLRPNLNIRKIEERFNAIEPLIKIPYLTAKIVSDRADQTEFSQRTLYLWMKAYRENGIEGLNPKNYRSGRKSQHFKKSHDDLILYFLDLYCAKDNTLSLQQIYHRYILKSGPLGEDESRITFSAFKGRLYRRKKEI